MLKNFVDSKEVVIDHYSENQIERPNEASKLKYDFDFRKSKDELWRYLDSANDISEFNHQIKEGESTGLKFEYRILISNTLEIVKTNAE